MRGQMTRKGAGRIHGGRDVEKETCGGGMNYQEIERVSYQYPLIVYHRLQLQFAVHQ